MFKKILFALFALVLLQASQVTLAEVPPPTETVPEQSIPAHTDKPASANIPAGSGTETADPAASKTQPNNNRLVDFRYCLELKTNREITECRYKK